LSLCSVLYKLPWRTAVAAPRIVNCGIKWRWEVSVTPRRPEACGEGKSIIAGNRTLDSFASRIVVYYTDWTVTAASRCPRVNVISYCLFSLLQVSTKRGAFFICAMFCRRKA
jgi:hypothetical protein